MVSRFRVEDEHLPEFQKIYPQTGDKSNENIKEALKILRDAATSFALTGAKSEISGILNKIKPGQPGVNATFGYELFDGKPKTMVYSIKLEDEGENAIITLRVGPKFTELSLFRGDKLCEMMSEKNREIIHEVVK